MIISSSISCRINISIIGIGTTRFERGAFHCCCNSSDWHHHHPQQHNNNNYRFD